jgi:hypothetical protein
MESSVGDHMYLLLQPSLSLLFEHLRWCPDARATPTPRDTHRTVRNLRTSNRIQRQLLRSSPWYKVAVLLSSI